MSNYTWPQKCPDLVQDVSLKRARIDNGDGTSTIRTTSSSSTDVTAITQALGNQADTISQPSVIGLLKNLVANSGGEGGGESSTYPVFKSLMAYAQVSTSQSTSISEHLYSDSLMTQPIQIPEWAKVVVLCPNSTDFSSSIKILKKGTQYADTYSLNYVSLYSEVGTNLFCAYWQIDFDDVTFTSDIVFTFGSKRRYDINVTVPSTISVSVYSTLPADFIGFHVFFFDTDPLEISGGGGGGSGQAVNTYSLTINGILSEAIDSPVNTPPSTNDKTLATLGSFQKRYKSWYSSIVFTPDTPKTASDLPTGFQAAIYQATEAEFTGTYFGVQVHAKFKLTPNSEETIITNPVVCYNTNSGAYSHTRGFILKLQKTSSEVILTMEQATSIDFGNNDNTFNSYVDSTTTFDVSYIKLKMTAY